jgi:hypothetical protein
MNLVKAASIRADEGNKTGPSSRQETDIKEQKANQEKRDLESLSFQRVAQLSTTAKKALEDSADTSLFMILKMSFGYPQRI